MRAIVVAIYLGSLPSNLPLWLASCAANPSIDWLLVVDQPIGSVLRPANVTVRQRSLDELKILFSQRLGFEVALTSPYKLNDFKPLFFQLLDKPSDFDFWGFCDLDVQFGRLENLLRDHLGCTMILSEGHLRFIRSTPECTAMYRKIVTPRGWRDILCDPTNFGMDEHHGLNRAFAASGLPTFADSSQVADIDPTFRQFRLLPQYRNYRIQAFAYENGRVIREYWHRGRYGRDEFLYIHFQKRKLDNLLPGGVADSLFISPGGFLPRTPGESDAGTIAAINPWHMPNRRELEHVLRTRARMLLRGDMYRPIRRGSRQ